MNTVAAEEQRFAVGDRVRVAKTHPPGHRRTPFYIRGKIGVIERYCGAFRNPEELAYGFAGEPKRSPLVTRGGRGSAYASAIASNQAPIFNCASSVTLYARFGRPRNSAATAARECSRGGA